jgi:hypothetical protein
VSSSFDPRITAYFGDAVLQAGFMPVPHLFLRHYRQLGLSHIQAMFTLQLMEIAWDVSSPPTSVSKLAARMGVGHRTIQVCSKEMHSLGLIEIYDQFDDEGAQVENGYDLSPLFRRLAEYAPVARPAGEIRARRVRTRAGEEAVTTESAPVVTNTPRVQESAPAPRIDLHRPPESVAAPPVIADSGLKEENKNHLKKQTRKKQQKVVVAAEKLNQGTEALGTREKQPTGHSLRWDTPLTADDVAQSRHVLQQIGLNALVADAASPVLHPAECWALWAYARGAGLGTAWIATQIYDFGTRCVRPVSQVRGYEAAGKLLASLPARIAKLVLDTVDADGPHVLLNRHNDERFGNSAEPAMAALEAVWAARVEQNNSKGERTNSKARHSSKVRHADSGNSASQLRLVDETPSQADPCWAAVKERLLTIIPREEFDTWIAPSALVMLDDEIAVIATPNIFVRTEIGERYSAAIAGALEAELGRSYRIELVIDHQLAA